MTQRRGCGIGAILWMGTGGRDYNHWRIASGGGGYWWQGLFSKSGVTTAVPVLLLPISLYVTESER